MSAPRRAKARNDGRAAIHPGGASSGLCACLRRRSSPSSRLCLFAAALPRETGSPWPTIRSESAIRRSTARFNRDVAEREISAALASGDIDLAQSFVALAADRGVAIDPALAAKVKDAGAQQSSVANTAGRFVHGCGPASPPIWRASPAPLSAISSCSATSAMPRARARAISWASTTIRGFSASPASASPSRPRPTPSAGVTRAGARWPFAGQGGAPQRTAQSGLGGAGRARGGESRGGRRPRRACGKYRTHRGQGRNAGGDGQSRGRRRAARHVAAGAAFRRQGRQDPRDHKTPRPRRHRAHGDARSIWRCG